MQLKSLRLFIDVVETGSFIAAAEKQHTVQSNVTAHIKKLEGELGTQLFLRRGGATITPAGKTLATYAKRILRDHDDVLGLFQGNNNAPSNLYLGAMETTTAVRLPPILADFHKNNPTVELSVDTGPTAELIAKLIEGSVDGIFIAGCPEHHDFHLIKAFTERLVLVGPKPLNKFPTSEELIETSFIAFRQGCSYRQRIELFLSSEGITSTRIFEFGSIDGILGCVAAGMGYTLMPLSTARAHSQRFDIDYLELTPEISELDTYFATSSPSTWNPAMKSFVAMLVGS
ncbi:LysR family transcriptional regulator [Neptuniibacter sp.]|uniref:LysR family transcriptional regulator n=1 Tax=Neptuniibacter sp. TaxID=1962643 RepID=UPI00261D5600|nr:LysR family transcriptional regulator [Neptuniibacter sp.]MCP4595378.1 LysR family transcriptional regulator [Neptuniibacter sp.]